MKQHRTSFTDSADDIIFRTGSRFLNILKLVALKFMIVMLVPNPHPVNIYRRFHAMAPEHHPFTVIISICYQQLPVLSMGLPKAHCGLLFVIINHYHIKSTVLKEK